MVNTTNNSKVATVPLSPTGLVEPGFLAVDVAANKVYVPYAYSVSVVAGASNTQIGTVTWASVNPITYTIALAPCSASSASPTTPATACWSSTPSRAAIFRRCEASDP